MNTPQGKQSTVVTLALDFAKENFGEFLKFSLRNSSTQAPAQSLKQTRKKKQVYTKRSPYWAKVEARKAARAKKLQN